MPWNSKIRPDYLSSGFSKQLVHHINVLHILLLSYFGGAGLLLLLKILLLLHVSECSVLSSRFVSLYTQKGVSGIDSIGSRLGSSKEKLSDAHTPLLYRSPAAVWQHCAAHFQFHPTLSLKLKFSKQLSKACLISPRAQFKSKLPLLLVTLDRGYCSYLLPLQIIYIQFTVQFNI